MRCRLTRSFGLLGVLLALPGHLSAESRGGWPRSTEGFVDLFVGAAMTQDADVEVRNLTIFGSPPISFRVRDLSFETSFMGGERVGFWWDFVGANLDLSYFRPDPHASGHTRLELPPGLPSNVDRDLVLKALQMAESDLHVVGIGLNAMLRAQFFSDTAVPQGHLQPYVFAGPTMFVSILTLEAKETLLGGTQKYSDTDLNVGLGFTAGAGLTYMFTKSFGLFAEYRFTYQQPEFDLTLTGPAGRVSGSLRGTLETHYALGGATFRF